jgi:hypothetical protein
MVRIYGTIVRELIVLFSVYVSISGQSHEFSQRNLIDVQSVVPFIVRTRI